MASQFRNATCPACAKNFTQTGFQSHLRQTKDPHCAALYAEIVGTELGDHWHDLEPWPFEGGAFTGHDDYMPVDDDYFGPLHNPDDDGSEMQVDLESGWEPERPGAQASVQTEDPQQDGDHDEPTNRIHQSQADTHIPDSRFVVRYSDKHPDHQAGAPIKKTQSADVNYRTALDNSSNPWAPFLSQVDWEIAKWAKLWGAGSTSFSDLLAIEGVSNYCGSACQILTEELLGSRSTQIII